MILAAGRGERMGALTASTPKPLLKAHGHYLIEYVIQHLRQSGITEIVVNVAYHGDQIMQALGNGSRYGVHLTYSVEEERLETGGGIYKALPLLGDTPFLVVSSDVVTDFPLHTLPAQISGLAHLVLVRNPDFHPRGDFGLREKLVDMDARPAHTFANIGIYHPDLFAACSPGYFPLNQLIFPAIRQEKVTGEVYRGCWFNIGTPEQLAEFEQSGSGISGFR